MILTIAVLALSLGVLLCVLIMAAVTKTHANLERSSFLKKAFTMLLVTLLTFLHMPLFDVAVRCVVAVLADDSNITI